MPFVACVIHLPCPSTFTYYLDMSNFLSEPGLWYLRVLLICLLFVFVMIASECHCFHVPQLVSVSSTGNIPGNPWGVAQKTSPGGRDLTFESCLGARNSTRAGILWKMKLKLKKNSVDQIFTDENKKKLEFLTFFEVYVFFQWNFSWSMGQFFHTYLTKS